MPIDPRPPGDEHVGVDRLIDLVHDLLAPEDARVAIAHIARCAACERALRAQSGTLERARAAAAHAPQPITLPVARTHDAHRTALRPSVASATRARRLEQLVPWCVGLASAACVLTALLLPTRPDGGVADARPWLPDPGDQIIVRSGDDQAGTRLRDGLLAYSRRDLPTAERLLESAAAPGAGDQLRRLYLADVMLHTGRPDAALEYLRSLRMFSLPEPWNEEARWKLLEALRTTGDRSRADSLQRALAATTGE